MLFALSGSQGARAETDCRAAGLAVDSAFCWHADSSVIDRRLEFLRDVAGRIMSPTDLDPVFDENKGAIDIVREQCATEIDPGQRMDCHGSALVDRIHALEGAIVGYLDKRLPMETVRGSGEVLASILVAIVAASAQKIHASPDTDADNPVGEVARDTHAVATGILLSPGGDGARFRILWENGTVAYTASADWRFDPAQLYLGIANLPAPFGRTEPVNAARRACIKAAFDLLPLAVAVTIVGPFQTGDAGYYMRLHYSDVVAYDCISDSDGNATLAAIPGRIPAPVPP